MGSWFSTPAATNATTSPNQGTRAPARPARTESSSAPPTPATQKEKCYDRSDPDLKFVDRQDEMDVFCMDFKSPRALMSCGHSATPMSLTTYCSKLLSMGESRFVCAVCKSYWSLQEVQKMALLTPQEMTDFVARMWENYKAKNQVKLCPGCKSSFVRSNLSDLSVTCPQCSAARDGSFIFCWQCLKEWRGPAPRTDRCNNEGCDSTSLAILRQCVNIKFENLALVRLTGCPSVRACPVCGLLMEHDASGCKCITCERCVTSFCFVCLKTEKNCSETSSPFEYCSGGVAPRQTFIPAGHNI